MTCDRCNEDITFAQWADGWCPIPKNALIDPTENRHVVTMFSRQGGERRLREAYHRMVNEQSYARTQP